MVGRDQDHQGCAKGEDLALSRFVREVALPCRASVREGYYEEGDDDGNREFSNGDVIDVRRIICPLVILRYEDPESQTEVRVSTTTRNPDVRFHVLTKKETTRAAKPCHFHFVHELIDSWPHVVKCLSEHTILCSATGKEPESVTIRKYDELRLIRLIFDRSGGPVLECRVQRTTQLIRLQPNYAGSFVEIPDRMSYTLRELVDIACVERNLRVDYTLEKQPSLPNGIPSAYNGVVVMERPEVLVEICRLLRYEDSERDVLSTPLLVPVDCDIQVSPRHEEYSTLPIEPRSLVEFQSAADHVFPVMARIVGWTEQSGILLNHVTRPGDHVMLYARTAVDRVLAHCGEKYFLIPTSHSGRFLRLDGENKEDPSDIQLSSLDSEAFPFDVQYNDNETYANTRDDLPSSAVLTFSAFIKADPCVVVSKLFGDVIGEGFHLPLRTKIAVQLQKRVRNMTKTPSRMSIFDHCSEEVSESAYKELMKSSPSEQTPTRTTEKTLKNANIADKEPPPVSARGRKSSTSNDQTPVSPLPGIRPLPPVPDRKLKNEDDDDDDDDDGAHEYSYIDFALLEVERNKSAKESTKHAGIVIPSNGNISHFTVKEMLSFLKENNVPGETISIWKKNLVNGHKFASMNDDELAKDGLATPVIQFFRDRSRMRIVLNQL